MRDEEQGREGTGEVRKRGAGERDLDRRELRGG